MALCGYFGWAGHKEGKTGQLCTENIMLANGG